MRGLVRKVEWWSTNASHADPFFNGRQNEVSPPRLDALRASTPVFKFVDHARTVAAPKRPVKKAT